MNRYISNPPISSDLNILNGYESFNISDCNCLNMEEDDHKPFIVDFNILISDGESGDKNPFARRDLYRESIYEMPEENCLFMSQACCIDENNASKKSVRFAEDTVFVERDMESRFWKEFAERRRRRKLLKQQRLMQRQQPQSISLFDFVKMVFASKKSYAGNNNTTPNFQNSTKSGINNSTKNSRPSLAITHKNFNPVEANKDVKKSQNNVRRSKFGKICNSMRFW